MLPVLRVIATWLAFGTAITGWEMALAADKVVFVNDWIPGGDKALPFYAMHKGLFAAEGIEVTIRTVRGSSMAIESHDRRRRYGVGWVGCTSAGTSRSQCTCQGSTERVHDAT